MNLKTIEDLKQIKGKLVLLRVDFNVPLSENKVSDNSKILKALPTINYLLKKEARVVIMSHLGKVKKNEDKIKNNMKIAYEELKKQLSYNLYFLDELNKEKLKNEKNNLKNSEALLLQNTRHNKGEVNNDFEFASFLSEDIDIFVFDAFASSHRNHSSTYGAMKILKEKGKEVVSGFLLNKEIENLSKCVNNINRPFVSIVGGKKVSDKIKIIETLILKADSILIGGAMAYTFLSALNKNVGNSLVEKESIELAKNILKKGKDKIILPFDHIVTDSIGEPLIIKNTKNQDIEENLIGVDIGEKTIKEYSKIIRKASTLFWNGPMGVFEKDEFARGTNKIIKEIAKNKDVFSIIGGGDSAYAAKKANLESSFSFISTGGGASLHFIENEGKVDVLELIDKKEKK